jgi:hypothetical protein
MHTEMASSGESAAGAGAGGGAAGAEGAPREKLTLASAWERGGAFKTFAAAWRGVEGCSPLRMTLPSLPACAQSSRSW